MEVGYGECTTGHCQDDTSLSITDRPTDKQRYPSKTLSSQKNDVQSVADGVCRRVKIGLHTVGLLCVIVLIVYCFLQCFSVFMFILSM